MQSRFRHRPLRPLFRQKRGHQLPRRYSSALDGRMPTVEAPLAAVRQLSVGVVVFFRGGDRRRWRAASCAMSARSAAERSGSDRRTSVTPRARMHRRKNANENCPRVIRLLIDFAGWGLPDASSACVRRLMVMRFEMRYACSTAAASLSQWPSELGRLCFICTSVIREFIFLNSWPSSSGQSAVICAIAWRLAKTGIP
jgi:hypothetical protein